MLIRNDEYFHKYNNAHPNTLNPVLYLLPPKARKPCLCWMSLQNETGTYVEYVFRTPCLFSEHSRGQWRKTHTVYHIYIYIGIKIWLSPICHLFYLKHPFSSVPCAWFYHFVPRKFQTYTACWPQTTGVIYNMPSTSSSEGCGFYPWCYDCIQTNPPCYHRRNGETACETVRGKVVHFQSTGTIQHFLLRNVFKVEIPQCLGII